MRKRKAILVTGTSTGNGKSIAIHLARSGYKVFATVRTQIDLEMIKEIHKNLTPLILDIRYQDQVDHAFDFVAKNLEEDEELYAIVNNAGMIVLSPFETMLSYDVRQLVETNLTGHIFVIQKFLPLLKQSEGKIINISSVAGRVSFPLMGLYSATKAAINSLSDALRIELSKWNIDVITIEPGAVKTPGWMKAKIITDKICKINSELIQSAYSTEFKIIYKLLEKQEFFETSPENVARQVKKAIETSLPRATFRVGFGSRWLNIMSKIMPLNHSVSLLIRFVKILRR